MSARREKEPKRPTLASIDRWYDVHYAAQSGERWDNAPTFATVRRQIKAFRARVERLYQAVCDPFAPGAARVIAEGDLAWNGHGAEEGEDAWGATICGMGEALEWGLAGAHPRVLDRLRKAHAAKEAAWRAEHEARKTPEERHRVGLLLAERCARELADIANGNDDRGSGAALECGPLTTDEKRAILADLERTLFGGPDAATVQ